jgi:hypothetical protein
MMIEEKKSPNLLMNYESLDEPIINEYLDDVYYGVLDSHKSTKLVELFLTIDEIITNDNILGIGDYSDTTEIINSRPVRVVSAPKNSNELQIFINEEMKYMSIFHLSNFFVNKF